MKFKVGDRVKVVDPSNWFPNVKVGYTGTIMGWDATEEKYAVKFDHYDIVSFHSCAGLCPEGYGFWCEEIMLEQLSLILTFDDIRNEQLKCVIHTKTIEEAKKLGGCLCGSLSLSPEEYWDGYSHDTAFSIRNGVISGYAYVDFYLQNKDEYGEIYEFKDIEVHSCIQSWIDNTQCSLEEMTEAGKAIKNHLSKNKEDKPMKLTFSTTEGYRIDKSNNTKIPTITTKVDCIFGDLIQSGSATCDKFNYDERQGVLEAVANALFRGKFDREYNRAVKCNKEYELAARTCNYCGRVFDTTEERKAHEDWHVERRKARHERYLLRKRAKEIAFEEQAQKMAKEMLEEQK